MLDKNRAGNYKYVVEKLISDVMTPTFNPKEYIWVLGSNVLASLVSERNMYLKAEVELNTLYGVEITEGEGEEIKLVRKDYVV